MDQVVITVAEKTPPAAGKKQWTITDITGKRFGVFDDLVAGIVIGRSYILDKVDTRQWQGKTYFTIKALTDVGVPGPRPQGHGIHQPATAQMGQTESANYPPVMPTSKDEQIWVLGILQRAIQSGQVVFDEDAIVSAAQALRRVFQRVWVDGDFR